MPFSISRISRTLLALALAACVVAATPGAAMTALAGQQAAQSLPRGVERLASVEGVTEYRLANGLRVLLFPDQSKQTMTVNVTYLVGSRHENYGETGMAHLLEHLVFKGSPKHRNIPQEMTERGARPINGTTSWDRTNYYMVFTSSDANLEWALDLESDRMVNSFIDKKDLDSEMTVVRNEYEAGENSPFQVAIKRLMGAAFDWHNYSNLTIGNRSDIENVPIDKLKGFYQRYYQPDNAVLLVAGKFDAAKTLQLIADKFGPIPRPTRVLQPIYTVEPTQDGERTVQVRRVGDTQLIMAGYHIPAGSHPDFAALDVMSQILVDEPSGRLYKALVDSKKATSVGGFNLQLHDPGIALYITQASKEQSADVARSSMVQTIESFAAAAPSAEEVERARTGLLKQIDLNLNSSDQVGVELSEWIAMGDWRLFFLHRDRIKKVTAADVQRVAASYLKPTNRTVAMYVPVDKVDRAEIPPAPDVSALVRDYKGEATVAEGEAFDPSPANIESRAVRATAPNGLKMVFVPKQTRGDAVVASMTLRIGDEKGLMNRGTAGEFAGQMLMRGTAKHTRQQIQDELDRLKTRASVFGGPTSVNVYIESTRENLPAAMRLVAEILREPSFPQAEFEKLKQEAITGIESQRSEPQAAALIAFQRHLNPYPKGDVRYTGTLDEELADVKAATLEDVKKFYADFYGASTGELSVVGDFDQKQIETLAAELFGTWKSPRPFARLATDFKDIPATSVSLETPDKTNAVFFAGVRINVRDDHPDYPALVLGNYMLGGGFLNSRLAMRLRQKDGLSYTVGSGLNVSSLDSNGLFTAFAIYAPQNAAKLEAGFREEIERMLKDGFAAEEIEAAKKGYLQSRQVGRAQDRELAGRLSSLSYLGRTLAWEADFEKKILALTPEQINGAMRRHVNLSKISIFKAGDFAKTAPKQ